MGEMTMASHSSSARNLQPVWGTKGQRLCHCSCLEFEDGFLKGSGFQSVSRVAGLSHDLEEETENDPDLKKYEQNNLAQRIEDELRKKDDREHYEKVNVRIETGKLWKLLQETITFLKCSMCVPQLVANDYHALKKILSREELEHIKNLLSGINFNICSLFGAGEYEFRRTNFFTESSASSIEKFYTQYKDKDKDANPKKEVEAVWTVNNILHDKAANHPELFTNEMKENLPVHVKELISTLERLFEHIISEINKTPKEAEEEEIELSQMFLAFEQQGNEMVTLHSSLRPAIEENLLKIMEICQEVQGLKDQRRKLKEFLVNSHQKIRSNLEKKNIMYNLEAMKTTTEKMEPRNDLMAKHEGLVKDDLAEEKTLRAKKHKIEQVLQSVINKYDQGMEERDNKLAHLTEMYEAEMAQMKLLQERFDAQEKVYDLLMNEKSLYEEELWQAKLKEVKKKAAARKIQRFWRRYLMVMQAHGRKRGKGKGKGKRKS